MSARTQSGPPAKAELTDKRKPEWLIQGYDGVSKIYETRIGSGQISEKQIKALLMALTAKAGLNYDEIVGAYAKRRTGFSNDLLAVHKNGPLPELSCGTNPFFTARIITPSGRPITEIPRETPS